MFKAQEELEDGGGVSGATGGGRPVVSDVVVDVVTLRGGAVDPAIEVSMSSGTGV